MSEDILLEIHDGLALITFNRPDVIVIPPVRRQR